MLGECCEIVVEGQGSLFDEPIVGSTEFDLAGIWYWLWLEGRQGT